MSNFMARGVPSPPQDNVVAYMTLRKVIGCVGLLMPIAVRVGAHVTEGHAIDSISASYYTEMGDLFVSSLVLVGTFLACYRTPSWADTIVANAANSGAQGSPTITLLKLGGMSSFSRRIAPLKAWTSTSYPGSRDIRPD